jgi:ATP-dependent Zn protease
MLGQGRASEAKEAAIDSAVSKLADEAYQTTKSIMIKHKDLLDAVSNRLLEIETMDGFEFAKMVEEYTGVKSPMLERIPVQVKNELEAALEAQGKQ